VIPEAVDDALRARAHAAGTSLNEAAIDALAERRRRGGRSARPTVTSATSPQAGSLTGRLWLRLTPDDLREIEGVASTIVVQGARLPAAVLKLTNG
jgi:hypothetical protein